MARMIVRRQPGARKRVATSDLPQGQKKSHLNLLTHADEIDLCERMRAGDMSARDTLVERNLRLAKDYAAHYVGSRVTIGCLDYEDVYQNACMGLIEAANRYDGSWRFSTYATWWMRQAVNRGSEEQADAVRLPSYVHTARRLVNRADGFGEEPAPADLAVVARIPDQPISLEAEVYTGEHDSVCVGDIVPDETAEKTEAVEDRIDLIETLEWIRGHLTAAEWALIARRITHDQEARLEDVGRGYGRETTRQRELRISRKLRMYGLCPDWSIRPHGPIARAARVEQKQANEKHSGSQKKTRTTQTLSLSA